MPFLFWDASAVVPLLLPERKSPLAQDIWEESQHVFAWDWLSVEVDAALTRRRGDPDAWRTWSHVESRFDFAGFENHDLDFLRSINRGLGLRAADAGHVYFFEKLSVRFSDLLMVTFDREMADAVEALGLPLHMACTQS